MIQTIQREMIVDTLLNTLAVERYVRGPLLNTILDELAGRDGLQIAAEAARAMKLAYEAGELAEPEFATRIDVLRRLVHAAPTTASAA